MIDFALSNSGDILIGEDTRQSKELNITFSVNHSDSLMLSFFVEDSPKIDTSNSIVISFDIEKRDRGTEKILITDREYTLRQLIKNVIFTTVGELRNNEEFGSDVEYVMHDKLFDKDTIKKANMIVKEALDKIEEELTFEITPQYKAYPIFRQGLFLKVEWKDRIMFNDFIY